METNNIKEMEKHIVFDKNCDLTIKENDEKSYSFVVENNCKVSVLLDITSSLDLNVVVKDNGDLKIAILNKKNKNNININGVIEKEAGFTCVIADFCKEATSLNSNVDLKGEYSTSKFVVSSTSNDKFKKTYNINFNHLNKNTTSKIKAFCVSLKESEIQVTGVSYIPKESVKSNASQEVKIILFDKNSRGKASPILKIECDDIKASHGCSIGSINDDHLYYLLSRGIDIETVRKLIVLGYILPIKEYFNEQEKKYIDEYIREDFNYD